MDRPRLLGTQGGSQWDASWRSLGLSPQGGSFTSVPEDLGLRPYESALVTTARERLLIPAAVLGRAGQGRAGQGRAGQGWENGRFPSSCSDKAPGSEDRREGVVVGR